MTPAPIPGGVTDRLGRTLDRIRRDEHRLALFLSVVIGALVGLLIVAFILVTGRLAARLYPVGGDAWRRVLVPVAGSLISGYLLFRYFPQARGSGIPQTKFALFIADGMITLRTVVGKFVCCAISLASGIALGREGPSVQLGAGVASVIGRRLGLGTDRVKALLPVGGAAALAAAFNTPIAAVLFSLEEIVGDLHAPILAAVVLSAATAWMVLHLFLGDAPLFHVAGYQLVHPGEFAIYALLGVAGGLASGCFVRLLLALRGRFLGLDQRWAWLHPAVGGLTVGVMGYFVPEVLGVGYDYVERVLNGDVLLGMLTLLAVLKIIATAVSYASGNAGGVFGPSLFIGAMVGGAIGTAAHAAFPASTAGPGAYALVGMGTAFAGIVRTPLASVIMIFELTRDYSIIVPLMISNLIAFYVSHRLQRIPIYEAIALQDGVHLPTGETRHRGGRRVADVMSPVDLRLAPGTSIADAAEGARHASLDLAPVFEGDAMIGVVRQVDLDGAVADGMGEQPLSAMGDAMLGTTPHSARPHVHPDHSLALALERMGTSGHRLIPVVSRADRRRILGLLGFAAVVSAFESPESPLRPAASSTHAVPARRIFVVTVAIVAASMATLAAADVWLVRMDRRETRAEATRLFEEGRALAGRGSHDDAIGRFRGAVGLVRDRPAYHIALARALLAAGRISEARTVADDVLHHEATSGDANLTMARILARAGEPANAVVYYQRAALGHWPDAASGPAARLELVELLARTGPPEALLAELLALQQRSLEPDIERRVAALYLVAGDPSRSLDLWRELQRTSPGDPSVYRGIAEAELARGNYRAARTALRTALRLAPEDAVLRRRLELCESVLALDPTQRGLGDVERHSRSVALVGLARDGLTRCRAALEATPSSQPTPLPRRAAEQQAAAEANIDLAEALWQARQANCAAATLSPAEEALVAVLTRTSR